MKDETLTAIYTAHQILLCGNKFVRKKLLYDLFTKPHQCLTVSNVTVRNMRIFLCNNQTFSDFSIITIKQS